MPILWRYLLSEYIKTFSLCIGAFIAILLTMRLDEIANFITLSPSGWHLIIFVLQQIPYILPITFPVASLIASLLVTQQLSETQELTAARACGFALRDIFLPILLLSLFLSVLNFYIVSEVATQSHQKSNQLKSELRSLNPLILIHNKNVMRMKGFYFDTLGPSKMGEFAQDIVFFTPSRHSQRMNVMLAREFKMNGERLEGRGVTLITNQKQKKPANSETVMVENMATTEIGTGEFSDLLEKNVWSLKPDHMKLSYLLAGLQTKEDNRNQIISEVMKRLSVALSVFTFTLMGLAFGTTIGRRHSPLRIIYVILLAAVYMIAFFIARSIDGPPLVSALLYFAPLAFIILLSLRLLYRVSHGVE